MSDIHRTGTTRRWSDAVTWRGLIFLCEVPSNLDGDIAVQAREVLQLLESRLIAAGANPSRLLSVTIILPYPADLDEFNRLWDEWVPAGSAPVRACIHAALTDARMRVEIQATAATS